MTHPFRFGVNMIARPALGADWAARCRALDEAGYDTLLVPDHLGIASPFPALTAAACAVARPKLGTFVLNAAFWNPALLAREVATLDGLAPGRVELGLGAGYNRAEFDAAGLPWEKPGARVERLERLLDGLDATLGDRRPPLLMGGQGDRMLRLAAARADVVAFTGTTLRPGSTDGSLTLMTADALAERVAFLDAAHERAPGLERNLLLQAVVVTDDREAAADAVRRKYALDLSTAELLRLPKLLVGTEDEITEQLLANRERLGFSYICVMEPWMAALAPFVSRLRGR